jgi:uncharacterized protein YajQ (UPF0234 family)
MPSFDITSEADLVALKNAVDVAGRHIGNRYDFKGSSARVELNEKDKLITLHGDSEFQLGQIKDILFPEMEKKERESTKRLDHGPVQTVGGNKAKQELKIKVGIEQELAKQIVKTDQGQQAQGAGQHPGRRRARHRRQARPAAGGHRAGEEVDDRLPLQYGNFRD